MEHNFIEIENTRIHYVSGGQGSPIIMLAGYPQTWYAWRNVIPGLIDQHRVYVIDLPGQGESGEALLGYDTLALASVIQKFAHTVISEKYKLVGHDVGAWVSFPLAHIDADYIDKLVLVDGGIPGVTLPDSFPSCKSPERDWHFLFQQVPDLPEILIQGKEKEYLEWFFKNRSADPDFLSAQDFGEYLRVFCLPDRIRRGLNFYRGIPLSAEQNSKFGEFKMPVLTIAGDQSLGEKMEAGLRKYSSNLQATVLKKCGHYVPEEKPEEVTRLIRNFLAID